MSINTNIRSGLKWAASGQAIAVILQLSGQIVLLRLVSPKAFGVLAMVSVFTGFLGMVLPMGTSVSIVQIKSLSPSALHSIFWWNAFGGILGGIAIVLLSSFISTFYQTDIQAFVFTLLSASLFFQILGTVPNALLQRQMKFRQISVLRVFAQATSLLLAILLALAEWPLMALAIRPAVSNFILLLGSFYISSWLPLLKWSYAELKNHLQFGGAVTFNNLLGYGVRNLDDTVIGRLMGAAELGLYNKSYTLLLFPITKISSVVHQVYTPVLARIQDQPKQIGQRYLRLCAWLSSLSFPLMVAISLEAQWLIESVAGSDWLGALPLVRLFGLLGALQSIGTLSGMLFQITNKVRLQLKLGLMLKPLMMTFILIAAWAGRTPFAVASAYGIASVFSILIEQKQALKAVHLSLLDLIKSLSPALVSTLLGTAICWLVWNWEFYTNTPSKPGKMGVLFILSYLLSYWLFFPVQSFRMKHSFKRLFL